MRLDDLSERLAHRVEAARENLPERVSQRVDALRDRTAGAVAPDGESVVREVSRLGGRLDELEERLGGRIDRGREQDAERLDALLSSSQATTWPRRAFWLLVGVAAGAGAAYLADPDRGRARRDQLSEQVAARARDIGDDATKRVKMAADRARGSVIETAKGVLPEDVPDDPRTLEARIHSTVFGARDDVADVVLRVDGPGQVALKGTVPGPASERELLAAVADVEGVIDVRSELAVRRG